MNIRNPTPDNKPKIFHFHLFKNSGTSIDSLLKLNFPLQWAEKEFQPSPTPSEAVLEWIADSPETICFSSHTAQLGVLNSKNVALIPIIFVRHPIDRIGSVYRYEKMQKNDGWANNLARTSSMREYIEERLKVPRDWQCRNYHCSRLLELFMRKGSIKEFDMELVYKCVELIPFIGVVERFQESMDIFKTIINVSGYAVAKFNETRENSTSNIEDIDVRLNRIREEVGNDFYERLCEVNRADLSLYDAVVERLDQRIAVSDWT